MLLLSCCCCCKFCWPISWIMLNEGAWRNICWMWCWCCYTAKCVWHNLDYWPTDLIYLAEAKYTLKHTHTNAAAIHCWYISTNIVTRAWQDVSIYQYTHTHTHTYINHKRPLYSLVSYTECSENKYVHTFSPSSSSPLFGKYLFWS